MSTTVVVENVPAGPGQSTTALTDLLENVFKTRDLAGIKPMAMDGMLRGHDFAREKTLTRQVFFQGSAARFHAFTTGVTGPAGGRVQLTLPQIVGEEFFEVVTRPNPVPHRDSQLGVSVTEYDRDRVLITGISMRGAANTLPVGVGLGTNALPEVYAKLSRQQIDDLATEMGLPKRKDHLIVHIPGKQMVADNGMIHHILKENVNSYHGNDVCKTYGGLTATHMYRGLIPLSPQQAMAFGLKKPPAEHDGMPNPENPSQAVHNSWIVVPMGHVVSHIASHTSADLKAKGYCVHQLVDSTQRVLPFLVMDTWSVYHYIRWTVKSVMLNLTPMRLSDVTFYLFPLKTSDWLSSCLPMEHHVEGTVSFTLSITYVMFPRGFRERKDILPGLSPRFPSMSVDTIRALQGQDLKTPTRLLKGNDAKHAAATSSTVREDEDMDQGEY